jgi:hypothetical protein
MDWMFSKQSDTLNTSRKNTVPQWKPAVNGALVGLNQLWYADYQDLIFILSMIMQSGCKWIRQDIYSSYHLGRLGLKCSNGVELAKRAIDLRFWYGICFLTAVEVLDGFSSECASSGDIIANASALLYLSPRNYCGRSSGSHQNFLSYHAIRPVQTQCFRELTCGTNAKGLQWTNLLAFS